MLKSVIKGQIAKMERRLGESLDYARHIVDTSLGAFMRFAKLQGFTSYRKTLPIEAYYVARIVATRDEDCGPCVQIELNLARQEGVSDDVLQALIDKDPDALHEELAQVYRFTEAVVTQTGEEEALRPVLQKRHGDRGMVELAYAIAGPRIFPVLKRVLGYAKTCSAYPPRLPSSEAAAAPGSK